MLIGKNVPAKNIIGKVTMLPMTPAVSGFLATEPTSIPSEANSVGPKIRKGISHGDSVMCAPKANTPTATISRKPAVDNAM